MILELRNIRGGYSPLHDVLQGIDLCVGKGEAVGIIGLNGSGKSTLGKAILNMLPCREGSVVFKGKDISGLSTPEIVDGGISILHQGAPLFDNLSVWENLTLASVGGKFKVDEIRNYFGLLQTGSSKLMKMRADRLSGGQRHELALAMAILAAPQLMILDEPSAGLSPVAARSMYDTLEKLRSVYGLSILLIEQNIALADEFSKTTCLLTQGRITHRFARHSLKEIEMIMFN